MSTESHKYNIKPKKGQYYLRALNETIYFYDCDISYNTNEGLLVREIEPISFPFGMFNKSRIHISVNNSIIANNGKIINHYSKYAYSFITYISYASFVYNIRRSNKL